MSKEIDVYQTLNKVTKGAALKADTGAKSKAKTLRAVPADYFDRFDTLKQDGKVSGSLSAYIIEALREKLLNDESK